MSTINEQITRFRNAIVANSNAPRPNSRQMLTLLRDALAQELATTSGGASHPDWGNNVRIVSCVIRRDSDDPTWRLIAGDGGHDEINAPTVTSNSSVITINYGVTFTKVVTCMAVPDEVFAGLYEFGTSGGFDTATINVINPNGLPNWGGDLDFNGTTWSFNQRYGSGSTTVAGGTTKTITLTHTGDDCGLNPLKMTHTWDGLPPFTNASLSGTASVIRIPATYTPVNGDSIWIERDRISARQTVNPNSISSDTGNIWFFAIGITA